MSDVAHSAQPEFWRPPVAQTAAPSSRLVEACENCGSEFMVGARFCHACGSTRLAQASGTVSAGWTRHLEFQNIQQGLGLSTGSLIAFLIGLGCVLGAIAAGWIYSERNVLEWEAVQVYRLQWLLAASAAFVAGILLKKPGSNR